MSTTAATAFSIAALLLAVTALIVSMASKSNPPAPDTARLIRLEQQQRAILDHLGVGIAEPDVPGVLECLMRGQKIQAIKLYREATGAGLKIAKEAVEEIGRRHGL